MGTEADPLDVLVELTEMQVVGLLLFFFFPAYILLPTCFSDTQIQSPVNQSQAHDVQALLYLNPFLTFIHKYTYIHTFYSHVFLQFFKKPHRSSVPELCATDVAKDLTLFEALQC